MNNLTRITLSALLVLSAGAAHARPAPAQPRAVVHATGVPAEFVRRAAAGGGGGQLTLASPRFSSASWSNLLAAPGRELDSSGINRWHQLAWNVEELRIGMRGLTLDVQQRPNSAQRSAQRCSGYLQ